LLHLLTLLLLKLHCFLLLKEWQEQLQHLKTFGVVQKNIGKGLMQSDRAIVATFGTFGEAGMEALGNSTI
jgi:hypothetical protein